MGGIFNNIAKDINKTAKKKYKIYKKMGMICKHPYCNNKVHENKKDYKYYKKTKYCPNHRCQVDGCKKATEEGITFCPFHKCNNPYCPNLATITDKCNNCANLANQPSYPANTVYPANTGYPSNTCYTTNTGYYANTGYTNNMGYPSNTL